jgi:hypothetical protein
MRKAQENSITIQGVPKIAPGIQTPETQERKQI